MKYSILIVGPILCLLLVAPALAQDKTVVRATVPFDFWVAEQKFPAGDYVFKITDHSWNPTSPRIEIDRITSQGIDTKYVSTNDKGLGTVAKDKKLVFYREKDKYMLHQVISAGDGHVHDVSHPIEVVDVE